MRLVGVELVGMVSGFCVKHFLKQLYRILGGKSGLKKEEGDDAFEGIFEYIKTMSFYSADLYRRVLGGKGGPGM